MLTRVGKRPLSQVTAVRARHIETLDRTGDAAPRAAERNLGSDWPDRCLAATIGGEANPRMRLATRRVIHCQSGKMGVRWAAASLVEAGKSFRTIVGCKEP